MILCCEAPDTSGAIPIPSPDKTSPFVYRHKLSENCGIDTQTLRDAGFLALILPKTGKSLSFSNKQLQGENQPSNVLQERGTIRTDNKLFFPSRPSYFESSTQTGVDHAPSKT